ncbi:MAG: tetratricopeptide repeat protein [Planctomycetota bacterium]
MLELNRDNILFEFDVIINPQRWYFLYPKTMKLMFFEEYLLFRRKTDVIKIPYTSISSVYSKEGKAHLFWNAEEIIFGVLSLLSKGEIYSNITEQVINLILAFQNKSISPTVIPELFPELKPDNLLKMKRRLSRNQLLWVLGFFSFAALMGIIMKNVLWGLICTSLFLTLTIKIIYQSRDLAGGYLTRALFYLLKGNMDGAIQYLLKGVKVYPNHIEFNLYLAKIYFRKKEWSKAREYVQKVLYLNPHHQFAQCLINALESYTCDGHLNKPKIPEN